MPSTEELLRQGIDAARSGQRDTARALLMRVVEADERNELAWLWLSAVVDDPEDQRICLENVLDINPQNMQARRGIELLATTAPTATNAPSTAAPAANTPNTDATTTTPSTGATTPLVPDTAALPAQSPAVSSPPPIATQPAVSTSDAQEPPANPCPYCGYSTSLAQRQCPQCKQSLMARTPPPERRSGALTALAVLWGISTGFSALLTLGSIGLVIFVLTQTQSTGIELPMELVFALIFNLGLTVTFFLVTRGLLQRRPWAYLLNAGLVAIQVLVTLCGLVQNALIIAFLPEFLAQLGTVPEGVAGVVTAIIGVSTLIGLIWTLIYVALTIFSYRDFYGPWVRIVTDVPARDHEIHYNMGVMYKNKGMWYMAAREWEKAVRKRSGDATYRHALGLAYAQLKQFDQAIAELRTAQQLAPHDPQISKSIAAVEQNVSKYARK